MAEIARIYLERSAAGADRWPGLAGGMAQWAAQRGLPARDCYVLVPFGQLIAPARLAFAALGGWIPRVETTQTLARSLGPISVEVTRAMTANPAIDALLAQQALRRQAWAREWPDRDPAGFRRAATHLRDTAYALALHVGSLPPSARTDYWLRVHDLLPAAEATGGFERRLVRLAADWARLSDSSFTDRLFALRPAAWIALEAGGEDALTRRLLESAPAEVPCLVFDTDRRGPGDPDWPSPGRTPGYLICDDFEQEAQCAAAQVLEHLRRGEQPVALIVLDRVLVRRIRALLERAGVSIRDETGWKLSTTRAAAQVVTLLRAAQTGATTDALLDWLKTGTEWPAMNDFRFALRSLEASCRRNRVPRVAGLENAPLDASARSLLRRATHALGLLTSGRSKSLARWVGSLAEVLDNCGALQALSIDAAGRRIIEVLGLASPASHVTPSLATAGENALDLSEFMQWDDDSLESSHFLPEVDVTNPPQVIVTPMAQAVLRFFGAVVMPGADDSRLGVCGNPFALLSDSQALSLGLADAARRRADESLALRHLLDCKQATLLRRRQDAGQALGDSPLVQLIEQTLRREGRSFAPWSDPRSVLRLEPSPRKPSAPRAATLLPMRLSASAVEALRECPYRFFAKAVLRLNEPDELDRDLEKRDFGTWLHAVLHRFHATRQRAETLHIEVSRLHKLARECQLEYQLNDSEFLPFSISFKALAPRYIAWLHERDRGGLHWMHGEYAVVAQPENFEGVVLVGHFDRIDVRGKEGSLGTELIDYKTGSVEGLKQRVRNPLEDTQLAFYAAILPTHLKRPFRAGYLALDSNQGIEWIEHKAVEDSARILLSELGSEVRRLRSGAAMPALGEGEVCERCEVRGLCRRDHWPAPVESGT